MRRSAVSPRLASTPSSPPVGGTAKLPPVPPPPDIFAKAGRQGATFAKPGEMGRGFDVVVRGLFADGYNVVAEYEKVEQALVVRNALTPGALQVALNEAEDNARKAHKLAIVAKGEYERYMRRTEPIVGSIMDAATGILEKQKSSGARTKQITDGDVKATCAQHFHDVWEDLHTRRDQAKGMLAHIEKLSELATSKCRSLQAMINGRSKL